VKVLFVPRDDAARIFGGDVVQMNKTADALRELGVFVDIGPPEQALAGDYDLVHLWTSLHFPGALASQLDRLEPARERTPVALSTIWAPHHLVRWMDAARRWLFTQYPDAALYPLATMSKELGQIARRELDFTLNEGARLAAFAPHPFTAPCRAVLARIDLLLPNSWMESSAIFTYLGDFGTHAIVPNAVDAADFDGGDRSELPSELREREYVLMSARFDTRKQQDFAMLAIKDLDLPVVFIGERTDNEIFERVRALSRGRRAPVFSYPFATHERLRHFYAGARVHMLPSIFESPGLSSLEAALCDCALVVGNLAFEAEYFQNGAYYCDPCDAFSIQRAVQRAWDEYPESVHRRATLAKRIRAHYTWGAAAEATAAAYRQAINETPASASATPNH
jgi:glycosyltransferase involved in cell wall biosynthesis